MHDSQILCVSLSPEIVHEDYHLFNFLQYEYFYWEP